MNLAQVVNTKAVIRTERFVRIRGDCLNKDFMSVVKTSKTGNQNSSQAKIHVGHS